MPDLPQGTFTFLFTDIEGSTVRWERQATAMGTALARHDDLLRQCIADHGGVVFKTVGDAFCAVFATAPAALGAAIAAQRAIQSSEWGDLGPLRVRMALHTGTAEQRDDDYFGPTLNRVARLLSAGYGGQVLLSHVAQELVRDQLPEGVTLLDLGAHRLKDLIRPEQIFQVVARDLAAEFPTLKTLDARPTNLPVQPTPLIGREREVAEVVALLRRSAVRLLTLTGPGGTGKTRLSLQAAAEALDERPDGVYFVPLAPLSDPELVLPTIARALGLTEAGGQPVAAQLAGALRDRAVLLVLDNFEQVLPAAPGVADLLAAAPRCTALVTSRAVLRLAGEQEYPVPPLGLPDPRRTPSLEQLGQFEAVRLFIARAQAVQPAFRLTGENAPAVAAICHRLDGLPLAIELAAARLRLFAPQALLARLEQRLQVLQGGARNLPARQQTLRGAIDWSYRLLSPAEQCFFARLGVFAGSRTLDAITAVCDADGDLGLDVLDGVDAMLGQSLLRREEDVTGEPRFVMLETLHEYARERLAERGELEPLRRRHADYFLALVEEGAPQYIGAQQGLWLARLKEEHDNIRAALGWALERGEVIIAMRLCLAVWRFWWWRGYMSEGLRWAEAALAQGGGASDALRVGIVGIVSHFSWLQGRLERAIALDEEYLPLARMAGVSWVLGNMLFRVALAASERGDVALARAVLAEGLVVARTSDDPWTRAATLLGNGIMARHDGDYERAIEHLGESLAQSRLMGDPQGMAAALANLGLVALLRDDTARARALFSESLPMSLRLEDAWNIANCLENIAALSEREGQAQRSARLYGAAATLREQIGAPTPAVDRALHEQQRAAGRAQLGEASWAAAWAEGRELAPEQAAALALAPPDDPGAAPAAEAT